MTQIDQIQGTVNPEKLAEDHECRRAFVANKDLLRIANQSRGREA